MSPFVFNKNACSSEVESLLVRPVDQSINLCKASGQKAMAKSYTQVVRGSENYTKNVSTYNKSRIFWARNPNKSIDNDILTVHFEATFTTLKSLKVTLKHQPTGRGHSLTSQRLLTCGTMKWSTQ